MFYFLLILLVLLIVPIPIKFKATFKKGLYSISIYNIILFSNNDGIARRFLKKKDLNAKDNLNKGKDKVKSKNKINFRKLYSSLNNNKFKPKLKFNADIDYSLNDAANTALLYGLLCNLNPVLYKVFSVIFAIKHIKLNIVPKFKDMILLEFSINSIITLNLAQIIYMLFLVLMSLRKEKEVYPEKDSYVR